MAHEEGSTPVDAAPVAAVPERARGVYGYAAVLAVVALVAHLAVVGLEVAEPALTLPWAVLLLFYIAAEFRTVLFHFRREVQGFSLTEVPLVVGLFAATPLEVVAAAVVGTFIALLAKRSQRGVKLTVNMILYWLSTCAGVLAFHLLAGPGQLPTRTTWIAAFVAALVANSVSTGAVLGAIRLTEGPAPRAKVVASWVGSSLGAVTSTAVGLMIAVFLHLEPVGVVLLLGPLVAVDLTLRAYTAQRDRTDRLDFLYRSTQTLQRHANPRDALVDLLALARETFRGRTAQFLLLPGGRHRDARRLQLDVDQTEGREMRTTVDRHDEELLALLAQRGTVVSARDTEAEVERYLRAHRLEDFVAAPLQGETRSFGYLLVGDRRTDLSPLTGEEERLFGTLAAQVSVWLENSRLEQALDEITALQGQLSHLAFHDSLTGLPNRTAFTERMERDVAATDGRTSALLFMDVDGFKAVNDDLGHEAGDELLAAIAGRLSKDLRDDDMAARLGGDEFAIILHDVSTEDARRTAERLVERVELPFQVIGREVSIGISIGVAMGPDRTGTEWLRRADEAMYRAKKDPSRAVDLSPTPLPDDTTDRRAPTRPRR